MNVLITGLGFINYHLINRLLKRSDITKITVLLNKQLSFEQAKFISNKNIKIIYNIHDIWCPDIVFHFGACSNTTVSWENLLDDNLIFTQDLVEYLKDYPEVKIVFASTAGVYGNGLNGFKEDAEIDIENLSPYALSKYLGEQEILKTIPRILGGVNKALVLRLFNVWSYGEYEKHKIFRGQASPHATIVQAAKDSREVPIYNVQPEPRRDFIDVESVISFIFKLAFSKQCGIFNVGTGVARSFSDVRNFLSPNFTFKTKEKDFKPSSYYQYFTEADVSKLKSVVPFSSEGFIVDFC